MPSFEIHITSIQNKRAIAVLAHHLAQRPGVSLQKAQSMLQDLPVVYESGVSEIRVREVLKLLGKLGVTARAERATMAMPDHVPAGRPAAPARPQTPPPAQHEPRSPNPLPPVNAGERLRHLATMAGDPPEKVRRKPLLDPAAIVVLVSTVVVVAVVIAIVVNRGRGGISTSSLVLATGKRSATEKLTPERKGGQERSGTAAGTSAGPSGAPGNAARAAVSAEKKSASAACTDSARASTDDPDMTRAIRFYLMAISFNRYNLEAWYGLVGAYTSAGRAREAADATKEMVELFGDGVFAVREVVKNYGDVQDMSRSEDGTYRIEYRTRVSGEAALRAETFSLARALRSSCNCTALSIHASSGGSGSGLLAHVSLESFPQTIDDYNATATITYLR